MLLQRKYKEIKSYILLLLKKIQNKKQLLFSSGVMIGKQCHFEIIYGHASLGKEFTARNNFSLIVDKNGLCKIGDNCFFNINCSITCLSEITIGNRCTFGNNLVIVDHDHDLSHYGEFIVGSVYIGEGSWIGANVTILKNTHIGNNCVIAAGSVVSGTIPDNTILIQKRIPLYKKRV